MQPASSSIIPENTKGKALDLKAEFKAATQEKATETYDLAVYRLLHPSLWQDLAGGLAASFEFYPLASPTTHPPRTARLKDIIAIDIPGPGSSEGEGYDWVIVDALEENGEIDADVSMAMRLKATSHPEKSAKGVDHFFDEDATSTFVIRRIGDEVSVSYHGRNELANTVDVSFADQVRNQLIATGAKAGLSKVQWQALIEGLLK